MDICNGPCLHHCTAKTNENIKYLLVGLGVGLLIGFILLKKCNTQLVRHTNNDKQNL